MSVACPICFEELSNKIQGSPDICDHLFCFTCLEKWSKHGNFCPVDRKRFKRIINVNSSTVIQVKPHKKKKTRVLYDVTVSCEICNNSKDAEVLLLCDCCDLGYHCQCLTPPLKTVPSGSWYCPVCAAIEERLRKKKNIAKKCGITKAKKIPKNTTSGNRSQSSTIKCERALVSSISTTGESCGVLFKEDSESQSNWNATSQDCMLSTTAGILERPEKMFSIEVNSDEPFPQINFAEAFLSKEERESDTQDQTKAGALSFKKDKVKKMDKQMNIFPFAEFDRKSTEQSDNFFYLEDKSKKGKVPHLDSKTNSVTQTSGVSSVNNKVKLPSHGDKLLTESDARTITQNNKLPSNDTSSVEQNVICPSSNNKLLLEAERNINSAIWEIAASTTSINRILEAIDDVFLRTNKEPSLECSKTKLVAQDNEFSRIENKIKPTPKHKLFSKNKKSKRKRDKLTSKDLDLVSVAEDDENISIDTKAKLEAKRKKLIAKYSNTKSKKHKHSSKNKKGKTEKKSVRLSSVDTEIMSVSGDDGISARDSTTKLEVNSKKNSTMQLSSEDTENTSIKENVTKSKHQKGKFMMNRKMKSSTQHDDIEKEFLFQSGSQIRHQVKDDKLISSTKISQNKQNAYFSVFDNSAFAEKNGKSCENKSLHKPQKKLTNTFVSEKFMATSDHAKQAIGVRLKASEDKNNCEVQNPDYATEAKIKLSTELKRIEQEKWKTRPNVNTFGPKTSFQKQCKNTGQKGISQHLSQEVNQPFSTASLKKQSLLSRSLFGFNVFGECFSKYSSSDKKYFTTQYSIKSDINAGRLKIPRSLRKNVFSEFEWKHLAVR